MNNRLRKSNKISTKPVTINDMAAELGLSKTTISRAISGKGRIGVETREKVLTYIEKRGFKPNLIAKSLAVSKTFNIAVVLPTDAEVNEIPFFQTCLHSITDTVTKRDYDVVLSMTSAQNISGLKRLIVNQKVDGIILTRLLFDDAQLALLKQALIPFVVIGSSDDCSIVQVDSDHASGCREVMEYVFQNGWKKNVLLAGNPDHRVNKDRYAGYMAVRGPESQKADTNSVYWDMTDSAHIDEIMPTIMAKKMDCLVCMDDVICGRVLTWLRKHDAKMPSDVKVVSFHDSAAMQHHHPPITALHIHVKEIGSLAGNILLDAIEGKEVPFKNRVGYELAIRESTRAR